MFVLMDGLTQIYKLSGNTGAGNDRADTDAGRLEHLLMLIANAHAKKGRNTPASLIVSQIRFKP